MKSDKLFEKSKSIIPGGVNSPVRAYKGVEGTPPFINKGKGAFVWDVDGNKYIDFIGSWGPLILGHAFPSVIEAVKKTIEDGTSFGAPTEKELILAELIVNRVPGCEMVRLVNSGTEATMSAVRLARGITGRNKIIKFDGCYHGHADSFLIAAGSGSMTFGTPDSKGVTSKTAEDTLVAQFNNIETVMTLFDRFSDDISAVIIEPINGNAGCIPPSDGFLEKLKALCIKNNSLLIFDEVMTGFRISSGGASLYYDVIPDLYTFGKVIGGGFPIGAYGGSKELMKFISPLGEVYQAGTLSGNPIAVVAGIETLNELNKNSYNRLEELSMYFEVSLKKIIEKYNLPVSFKRVGSMFSIFFYTGRISNIADVHNYNKSSFNRCFKLLLQKGIYVAPSQYEVGFISLAHTKEVLDTAIECYSDVLINSLS